MYFNNVNDLTCVMLISVSCFSSGSVPVEMKTACDWKYSETGAGIERSDHDYFCGSILGKFPYFYNLKDVFVSRADIKPKATNKDIREDMENTISNSDNSDGCSELFGSDPKDGEYDVGSEGKVSKGLTVSDVTDALSTMGSLSKFSQKRRSKSAPHSKKLSKHFVKSASKSSLKAQSASKFFLESTVSLQVCVKKVCLKSIKAPSCL